MLSASQVEFYRREGYLVVRGVFGEVELRKLVMACNDLEAQASAFCKDEYIGPTFFNMMRACDPFDSRLEEMPVITGKIRRVTYPYMVSKIIDELRVHFKLLDTVAGLLGPDLVQIVNQINFNHPGIGTGWGWHQDYRFRRQGLEGILENFAQSLTAIDGSSRHNGGLRLVPRSHQMGALSLDLLDAAQAEKCFDASLAVTPVLAPGDTVFFNPYVIHGSTPNGSDQPRRVFINGYARKTACSHGVSVMERGKVIPRAEGFMEYEREPERLPLAAKY